MGPTVALKIYDLIDPEPRIPIYDNTFTIVVGAGVPLPSECAVAMSYAAAAESGIPVQRRRGRLFLGPWDVDGLAQIAEEPVIDASLMALIQGAGQQLLTDHQSTDVRWCVFSPTTAGAKPWDLTDLDGASFVTVSGHIDNQFDTIRSRGGQATDRAIFD